jgi:eukaryotic-like serine/threonine-protein kinase
VSRSGPAPFAPGTAIAPGYRLIEHLSRGRVLDVYDAWSEERATRCIAKMLRPDRVEDRGAARRLLAEGRLLRRLSHPHIVRGYEVLVGPPAAVVMETLTGETLAHLIDEAPRRLPFTDIGHLGLHLASAIGYLHRKGWLHLDLKPANVVAEAGRAKLIDLSVARRPGRSFGGVGTWCYMAPEQATGGELGPAADVWGLGAVLYEAVTGEAAFDPPGEDGRPGSSASATTTDDGGTSSEATDPRDRHYRQLEGPAPPVGRLRRRVPPPLAELVAACLERDPARRPTVPQVLAALEEVVCLDPAERRWSAPPPGARHSDR